MKNKIQASIIIRTKNEEQWIDHCLKSIFNQRDVTFEVLIVDNNSTDKTVKKAKKFPVKVLKIKRFFPGKAINMGFKKSKGKYLICLSAHCIPENDYWLKNLIKGLSSKNIAGVYGRQKPLPYTSSFDKRDLITLFGPERIIQKKNSFFHNANSAIKREIWKKFPFDEKSKHIEDKIWGYEIIKNKYQIMYEPNASVFHWHGINQNMDQKRCDEIVKILENLDIEYKSKNIIKPNKSNIVAIVPHKGKMINSNKGPLIDETIKTLKNVKNIKKIIIPTEDKILKKYVEKKYSCKGILRPSNLSDKYIDITSLLKFSLNKIEKFNIFPDFVIVATENFPFRSKIIFNKMINKIIKHNYDVVICDSVIKGSILEKSDSKLNVMIDGIIPKEIAQKKYSSCSIGFGCIMKPANIRSGNLLSGKIGSITIKNPKEYIEINENNLRSL